MSKPPSTALKAPSAIYRLVWQAVRERQHIVFEYDGRRRDACPIILGYSDAGREAVKAYQVGGETSKGKLPAWRDFYLDGITALRLSTGPLAGRDQPQAGAGLRQIRRCRRQHPGHVDEAEAAAVRIAAAQTAASATWLNIVMSLGLSTSWPGIAVRRTARRFARLCPGHPRLPCSQDADARHKAGHDGGWTCAIKRNLTPVVRAFSPQPPGADAESQSPGGGAENQRGRESDRREHVLRHVDPARRSGTPRTRKGQDERARRG